MKFKTNISALVLAALVFVSSNGISLFEHICNVSQTKSFCFFEEPSCEDETPVSPCCEKMGMNKKDDCCSKKQFFSKLSVEGYTAKQLILKEFEKNIKYNFFINYIQVLNNSFLKLYSGLSPPDNLYNYTIKSCLKPAISELQVFRC